MFRRATSLRPAQSVTLLKLTIFSNWLRKDNCMTVADAENGPGVKRRLQNVVATVAVQEGDLFQNGVGSKYYCGYVDGVLSQHYTLIN